MADETATATATRIAGVTRRHYDTPDGLFPSVTSILDATIPKPGLIRWYETRMRDRAVAIATEVYRDSLLAGKHTHTPAGFREDLAGRLHRTKPGEEDKDKAAEIGTSVHELIERDLKQRPLLHAQPGAESYAFDSYQQWRNSVELEPLGVELTVWSKTYGYAGTLDFYGNMNVPGVGRVLVVGDWKTSRGIYESAMLQNAAYAHALVEQGIVQPPVHGVVVRLPKVRGKGAELRYIHVDQQRVYFDAFKNAVAWFGSLEATRKEMWGES